jgi:transposase
MYAHGGHVKACPGRGQRRAFAAVCHGLVRIIRRGSGPVVTWRRAQMVLLPAQGLEVPAIAKVAFTSEDRVRDVIRNFGFASLYPKYKGGHPPNFTPIQRREIKRLAKSRAAEHDLQFSTWSLSKLAEFLVAGGGDDISHGGLRVLLRREGVTFQRLKTWKASQFTTLRYFTLDGTDHPDHKKDRSPRPQETGQHDPPVHHLAQ